MERRAREHGSDRVVVQEGKFSVSSRSGHGSTIRRKNWGLARGGQKGKGKRAAREKGRRGENRGWPVQLVSVLQLSGNHGEKPDPNWLNRHISILDSSGYELTTPVATTTVTLQRMKNAGWKRAPRQFCRDQWADSRSPVEPGHRGVVKRGQKYNDTHWDRGLFMDFHPRVPEQD